MSFWDDPRRRMQGFLFQNVPAMMSCQEFENFIVDYEDGVLPRRQKLVFELHLGLCPDCRRYLRAYRNAVALGKALFHEPDEVVPEEVPDDLVRAILSARGLKTD